MRAHRLELPARTARPRRGMALAIVMIFLFVLTAALAAGFAVNVGERRLDDGGLQSAHALGIAELGLQRALVDRTGIGLPAGMPAAAESVRVSASQGFVDIIVTQLRPAVGSDAPLYLFRAHASRAGTRGTTGGESSAEETVTQLIRWQTGTMRVQSGWTSLSGLHKNGAAGSISGIDQCGVQPPLPAVAVPASPGYTSNPSGTGPLSGASPLVDTTLGATPAAAAPSVPINWAGIVNGSALTATYTVPPDAFPPASMFSADTNFWPIIKIVNPPPLGTSFGLPYPGRGMLIVEGDLTISGSNAWSGIVLVGGMLTSNGNNTVQGATVTGLNVKLGFSVPINSVGNGNKQFLYNSCSVALAAAKMGRLQPFSNTWSTTWPTY